MTETEKKEIILNYVLNVDKVTEWGVMIHSSLGNNPYNRKLTEKEKEYIKKYKTKYEERKKIYKKAVKNKDVTQSFSY